jgi:hypothetical protein
MGAAQFGSCFFLITGFHGTHVTIGVISITENTPLTAAHSYKPKFLAEVEYRDIAADGLLRAASFKGLTKGTGC